MTTATQQLQHHYFASTALNWAKAPTRAEAIAKLAKDLGAPALKQQVKANGGLYVWSCMVHAAQDEPYALEFFAPHGVEWSQSQEGLLQNVKGDLKPWVRK